MVAVAVAPEVCSLIHPYQLPLALRCPSQSALAEQVEQIQALVLAAVAMVATHHLVPQLHTAAVAVAVSKPLDAPVVPVEVADKTAMQIPAPHHKDSKVDVVLLQLDAPPQVAAAEQAESAQ